ncbi:hypothetical protein HER32_12050 [Hymenobacter sp. BT18]|uniref:hypothetical protein n=1 Tax=Hymenobacter sp. BT18 TaxID=2835648 RepID=UPI00143ECCF9|nr:hypothetical protein [Hymenobacter sp. BT18]QIX61875.1 hypothetical protein HER32_12050 [Hymenobacter sp. BT18]
MRYYPMLFRRRQRYRRPLPGWVQALLWLLLVVLYDLACRLLFGVHTEVIG